MNYNQAICILLLLSTISCHKQNKCNTEKDDSIHISSTDDLITVKNSDKGLGSYMDDSLKSVVMKLEKSFGDKYPLYYAGYIINRINNNLIILVIGDDILQYEREFAYRLGSNDFSIGKGKYPYKELLKTKKMIIDYIDTHENNKITQNIEYLEIYGNKVIIYLKDDSYQKTSEFRKEITDSPVISFSKINKYPGGIAE